MFLNQKNVPPCLVNLTPGGKIKTSGAEEKTQRRILLSNRQKKFPKVGRAEAVLPKIVDIYYHRISSNKEVRE
jgi:hypothetical protein